MPLDPEAIPAEVREWLPATIDVVEATSGGTADVVLLTNAPLIIKRAVGTLDAAWLETEFRALQALADRDLPIPEPVGVHIVPGGDGRETEGWLVTSRLPGTSLLEVFKRAETVEARADWYRRLGLVTARIHTEAIPDELRPDDPRRWIERVLERARKAPRTWIQRLVARFDRDRAPDAPVTLIHGDLTIDNVIADGDEITGVVDWGCAGPGDPRYDVTLALSCEDARKLEPEVVSAFFEGYGSHGLPDELRAFFEHAYHLAAVDDDDDADVDEDG